MKKILTLALLFFYANSFAQLGSSKSKFTRADTLRGSLRAERTCFDVKFYHLDIDLDIKNKSINGSNTIQFEVLEASSKIQIDLFENMQVDKIIFENQPLKYTREENAVFIDFPKPLEKNKFYSIQFFYSGNPTIAKYAPWDGGLVFKKDDLGNDWIGVACQGTGASLWWPNKDHQSDEPDSMLLSVRIPDTLMDISNGRLRKVSKLKGGIAQYDWFISYPINNYDVTLNVGKYEHFSDTFLSEYNKKLSLDYYVMPYNKEAAMKQFEQVKPMLGAFEHYFGPYPFYRDGYKLVESSYLGMEHQSAVAYGNKYKNGYLGRDFWGSGLGMKFDYIIIHESGHEWWGNQITAGDICDMWLQEGFTTYSEALYLEYTMDRESADRYLNAAKRGISNRAPIVGPKGVNKEGSGEMYQKGALILNTFRNVVDNDELFFGILKGFQEEYKFRPVSTADWIHYVNAKTGKDFTAFFNQFVNFAKIPELDYKVEKGKLSYRWIADDKNFAMPIKLKLNNKSAFQWIYPSTEWQILDSKTKVNEKEMAFDVDHFYFKHF